MMFMPIDMTTFNSLVGHLSSSGHRAGQPVLSWMYLSSVFAQQDP